jgi:nucleotide-binding universal stress UspA family protein
MKTSKLLSLRQILGPVDFSKSARRVLRYAIPLAPQFGARIALLHIVEPMIYPTKMAIVVTNKELPSMPHADIL